VLVKQFWSWVLGYLVIIIQSDHPERLINLMLSRGIPIWQLSWVDQHTLIARVYARSFFALRHLARTAHCRLRIKEKRGLPFFLFRLRGRKLFVVGTFIFCFLVWYLSTCIWAVEVSGNKKLAASEICPAAADAGLKKGIWRFSLDPEEISTKMLLAHPGLAYAEISFRGVKAHIRVIESTPLAKTGLPCHLVADKAGVIQDILVLSGTAKAAEGDVVKKGDLLISGIVEKIVEGVEAPEEPSPEEPLYVEARGIVRARVWYRAYGEAVRNEIIEKKTGRKARTYLLKIAEKNIILRGSAKIPFHFYDLRVEKRKLPEWRSINLPVEFVTIEAEEIEKSQVCRSSEEAAALAAQRARKRLAELLPKEAVIAKQQVNKLQSDENMVQVVLTAEVIEEIGAQRPIEVLSESKRP
jgi:similar to stage IV sporulation protein